MTSRASDQALRRILDDGRARAARAGEEHVRLWDALTAATAGGKRFRPALLHTVHDALDGDQPSAAAEVGAAVELLHTAFLVHDDVIDEDDVRRGTLNVSGTFRADALRDGASPAGAAELSRAAGILAGDLALAAAVRAVALCGATPTAVSRLLDLFDDALHTTAAGELADVGLSLGTAPTSLEASLLMAEQKTSAYSFALPLQAGAVLAGAAPALVDRLAEVGRDLGLAFQLADDLIGVFGDPDVTGKSTTGDLRTAKRTPLLAHAAGSPQWARLRGHLGRELTPEELEEARGLFTAAGSRRYVEDLADAHLARARGVLADLGLPADLLTAAVTRSTAPAAGGDAAA